MQNSGELDTVQALAQVLDLHQDDRYATAMESIGWKSQGRSGERIFYRNLGPFVLMKAQRIQSWNSELFLQIKKKGIPVITQVEPGLSVSFKGKQVDWDDPEWDTIWKAEGFRQSRTVYAHTATSFIDLRVGEEKLLSSFKQKTRYNIKKGLQSSWTISSREGSSFTDQDHHNLDELFHRWKREKSSHSTYGKGFVRAIIQAFGDQCRVFEARNEKHELQAFLIYLQSNELGVYFVACSSKEANKRQMPSTLTWTAIKYAINQKRKFFDFYGIYDPRYPKDYKDWKGFTAFKEGFRPQVIQYPRPWR